MTICPNCKHNELQGAIFCSECGTQLIASSPIEMPSARLHIDEAPTSPVPVPDLNIVGNSWISMHLIDTGEFIPLKECNEFTLGRASENQPIMPDVDLTCYKAYENGVSRLHAVVRRTEKRVIIMDLGSSNGTYINGVRIAPNLHQVIRNGDVVSIGKLKIQIILT
jgi:hypothetical protein